MFSLISLLADPVKRDSNFNENVFTVMLISHRDSSSFKDRIILYHHSFINRNTKMIHNDLTSAHAILFKSISAIGASKE